jgi:hypothetical protein
MGNVSFFQLICNNLAQRCTHTHKRGEGRREGTRTASHNQQRGNKRTKQQRQKTGKGAHNTQAEQRKENGVACRRAIGAKQNRQQSKTTAARKLKQDGTGEEQTHFQGLGRGRGVCSRSLFVKTQKAR